MEKLSDNYIKATKDANKAKAAGGIAGTFRKVTVTTDKNGNVIKTEKGPTEKLNLKPATTEEVFGAGKAKMKKTIEPLGSDVNINNADQTEDWMSVGDMLK